MLKYLKCLNSTKYNYIQQQFDEYDSNVSTCRICIYIYIYIYEPYEEQIIHFFPNMVAGYYVLIIMPFNSFINLWSLLIKIFIVINLPYDVTNSMGICSNIFFDLCMFFFYTLDISHSSTIKCQIPQQQFYNITAVQTILNEFSVCLDSLFIVYCSMFSAQIKQFFQFLYHLLVYY